MENPPPTQEPTTIEGIAIHMSYMRRDLASMNTKLDSLTTTFVSQVEFDDLKKVVEENKGAIKILTEFKDTLTGKMWGIGVMAGTAVSIISIIVNHIWK